MKMRLERNEEGFPVEVLPLKTPQNELYGSKYGSIGLERDFSKFGYGSLCIPIYTVGIRFISLDMRSSGQPTKIQLEESVLPGWDAAD